MCMVQHLSFDREAADWVMESKGAIRKDNLTFTSKFLWLISLKFLYPIAADKIVTWERTVMILAMIAGFEVNFAWLLQAVMHKRAFKVTSTYLFQCIAFSSCSSARETI